MKIQDFVIGNRLLVKQKYYPEETFEITVLDIVDEMVKVKLENFGATEWWKIYKYRELYVVETLHSVKAEIVPHKIEELPKLIGLPVIENMLSNHKREAFALVALYSLSKYNGYDHDRLVKDSVKLADALLKELGGK